ncbi:hypothetical protein FTO74_04825 [Granulicella sp. WH15]|uniref:hypothetical protein n=1 Tax=Granulicella sp. WH15 TaxID=2602070 RepID=UPI0013672CB8|nr:hypothetical protein [Granulicella sp. WH15]QHN02769.1 hypothetical protein FTO74_04825 [Granulicella sp. WH15]
MRIDSLFLNAEPGKKTRPRSFKEEDLIVSASDLQPWSIDEVLLELFNKYRDSMGDEEGTKQFTEGAMVAETIRTWQCPPWLQTAGLTHRLYLPNMSKHWNGVSVRSMVGIRAERIGLIAARIRFLLSICAVKNNIAMAYAQILNTEETLHNNRKEWETQEDISCATIVLLADEFINPYLTSGFGPKVNLDLVEIIAGHLCQHPPSIPIPSAIKSVIETPTGSYVGLDRAYEMAVADLELGQTESALRRLLESSKRAPWIAELKIYLAYVWILYGKFVIAGECAETAEESLLQLGLNWDKRLSFIEWLWLSRELIAMARAKRKPINPLKRAKHAPIDLIKRLT